LGEASKQASKKKDICRKSFCTLFNLFFIQQGRSKGSKQQLKKGNFHIFRLFIATLINLSEKAKKQWQANGFLSAK